MRREVLAKDERYVGLLLPPSVGGVLANAALTLDGRVAVNLNYTVSSDVMNQCIDVAGIRHVLTSRRVMKKLDLKIDAGSGLPGRFQGKSDPHRQTAAAATTAWIVPVAVLETDARIDADRTRERDDDNLHLGINRPGPRA